MSFCRWSTDDFRCDLFVYGDLGCGYTVHVACARRDFDVPPEWDISAAPAPGAPGWSAWYRARREALHALIEAAPLAPIGLPHDGVAWDSLSAARAVEVLHMLRAEGYRFPDRVFQAIEDDHNDPFSQAMGRALADTTTH